MAKRRKVILGLGALIFGSGATTMSGAFNSAFSSPESDLRVIADSGLRVRAARDGTLSETPIVKDEVSSNPGMLDEDSTVPDYAIEDNKEEIYSDFDTFWTNVVEDNNLIKDPGAPEAVALEIDNDTNDELGIRTAISTRLKGEIDPLLEVTNTSGQDYDIKINYAENSESYPYRIANNEENGYGSDVWSQAGASGNYDGQDNSKLSRREVQEIYQFKMTSTSHSHNTVGSSDDEKLISPKPQTDGTGSTGADEGANSYPLPSGETAFIELEYNTGQADIDADGTKENLVGRINKVAGQGSNPFQDTSNLDLLNNIYVTASAQSS